MRISWLHMARSDTNEFNSKLADTIRKQYGITMA